MDSSVEGRRLRHNVSRYVRQPTARYVVADARHFSLRNDKLCHRSRRSRRIRQAGRLSRHLEGEGIKTSPETRLPISADDRRAPATAGRVDNVGRLRVVSRAVRQERKFARLASIDRKTRPIAAQTGLTSPLGLA